jgi:hypothetical protein
VFECACDAKHRFTSGNKTAGEGVVCQDDKRYRHVGAVTQAEGETYRHARYRALLTKFETVN